VRAVTASGNRDRKGILRLDAAGLHAFVTEDAFGVIADVKFIVYFHRLRMLAAFSPSARGLRRNVGCTPETRARWKDPRTSRETPILICG